ncbi:MAG: hypothetical protein JKY43_03550 [Phycisphaerales bacterium]|nr:hypothetical protein [Phycisphaerales bacterium]
MLKWTVLVVGLLVSGHAAAGGVDEWIGGIGDWSDPANWADGTPPNFSNIALINNGGTAVVTNENLLLGSGVFGGDLNGQFGDGGFEQHGGSTSWDGFGGMLFGRDLGTTGRLALMNGATLSTSALVLGWNGNAVGEISGGSQITLERLAVGGRDRNDSRQFLSSADLVIRGPGTLVQITQTLSDSVFRIGLDGSGSVTITDGAVVETTSGFLASTTAAGSSLVIDGPDSVLRVSEFFHMGRDIRLYEDHPPVGGAVLTLRNGGTLDTQNASSVVPTMLNGSRGLIQGTGVLLGDVFNVHSGVIDPGELGTFGRLEISGMLDNSADYSDNPNLTGGILHFDLGGTSLGAFDQLVVGSLSFGGILEIALAEEFNPVFGDSFEIITILDQVIPLDGFGEFDFIMLPELNGGLFFETAINSTSVTLTVVPAPSTLIVLGGVVLLGRRRRLV